MVPKAVPGAESSPRAEAEFEILARINRREQEIEGMLRAAREAAAEKLREAHRRGDEIVAGYRAEADRVYALASADILDQARRAAEEILSEGTGRAAAIRAVPRERVDLAARHLQSLILPVRQEGHGP